MANGIQKHIAYHSRACGIGGMGAMHRPVATKGYTSLGCYRLVRV